MLLLVFAGLVWVIRGVFRRRTQPRQ
jgi:hypothetical protein